jgi:hypothetical protein
MRRADHSSNGIVPTVVYECDRAASVIRKPWPTTDCCVMEQKTARYKFLPRHLAVKHMTNSFLKSEGHRICQKLNNWTTIYLYNIYFNIIG